MGDDTIMVHAVCADGGIDVRKACANAGQHESYQYVCALMNTCMSAHTC